MRLVSILAATAFAALVVSAVALAAPTSPPVPVRAPPAAHPTAPAVPAAVTSDQTYVLGPADVIEVSLIGRTDYSSHNRISEDGTIQLQYLGNVVAANKTAQQLGDEIAAALDKGGYFSHPSVRVDITSYASRYVTVLGNVGTPGLVPVDRPYRLSEIVARVGGVRETGADYIVLSPQHGASRHILISTLATGATADDPFVAPGDKIYSPPADVAYVSGQIKGPGAFAVILDMTVRMALARSGGLTDSGSDKKVTITRKGVKINHVNLDSKVQAGDVILVGERLF